MAAKEISLKLLVHKEKNQVVFAESGQDFVDVLFSFLTMPIGTIVRLVRSQSKIGGMSMLYESVEDLDLQLLQTEACKNMLLYPKSTSEERCKNLKVNIDDTKPTEYYICLQLACSVQTHKLISTAENARCRCGKVKCWNVPKKKWNDVVDGKDGVFVKADKRFMISDDLLVSPVSTMTSLELLKKLGISDWTVLEERDVNVGAEEVLNLLKLLLLSKTPLTDLFLREVDTVDGLALDLKDMAIDSKDMYQSQIERDISSGTNKISMKLIRRKSNRKVLYAEAGEEFVDLLFSFLAFPLGSIVKCLGGCTSIECLDNLYKSVEELSNKDCMKSEECKALLLEPKLAPYFSSKNQPIQIEEQVPWQPTIFNCSQCCDLYYRTFGDARHSSNAYITDEGPGSCSHGSMRIQLSTMNPKYPDVVTELGGAYMAGESMFMLTDNLNVKLLSPILGISLFNEFNITMGDLEERVVSVGQEEVLSLLKASLVSKTVLSDVFCLKKPKQMGMESYKRLNQRC